VVARVTETADIDTAPQEASNVAEFNMAVEQFAMRKFGFVVGI